MVGHEQLSLHPVGTGEEPWAAAAAAAGLHLRWSARSCRIVAAIWLPAAGRPSCSESKACSSRHSAASTPPLAPAAPEPPPAEAWSSGAAPAAAPFGSPPGPPAGARGCSATSKARKNLVASLGPGPATCAVGSINKG